MLLKKEKRKKRLSRWPALRQTAAAEAWGLPLVEKICTAVTKQALRQTIEYKDNFSDLKKKKNQFQAKSELKNVKIQKYQKNKTKTKKKW